MHISVFGLGYVGAVSAACFASKGHMVIGVDSNPLKVEAINKGIPPIIETGLKDLTLSAVEQELLKATTAFEPAVLETDISFICVGTPSLNNGDLDCSAVENVCTQIGSVLAHKQSFHVVVVRSTILPGTIRTLIIPLLEKHSGKKAGVDFGVCNNPEFMREGTAVYDFLHPPKTVIGETDSRSGDMTQSLYEGITGPMIRCPIEIGEMVKYADNAWHATKVVFANEIGAFCKAANIDSHRVMDIFCQDTKLNLSPYYLKPGFAFGGSCLPKDVRALNHRAQILGVEMPLLGSLLPSNEILIESGVKVILATQKHSIGFLGVSFKAGTDDLRESPMVEVIKHLLSQGLDIKFYDAHINLSGLTGANHHYVFKTIPDIESRQVPTSEALLKACDVIVIGKAEPEFSTIGTKLKPEHVVIDFVRIKEIEEQHENYHGICW